VKLIELSQGYFAKVDDKNYEMLMNYPKWFVMKHHGNVYAKCNIALENGKRTTLKMHRVIMDAKPGQIVDHWNGDGLDNQEHNLRVTNCQKNSRNRKSHTGSSSKYKGVAYHIVWKKWQANICVNGKNIYLGLHENEIEAALVYDIEAIKYFGEFARLNFPNELQKSG
jgi:hypothetical protein